MPNGDLFKGWDLEKIQQFQDRFYGTPIQGTIGKLTYPAQRTAERESLQFTDKEKEQYINELLRSIGTLQSQQLNRASETAARVDLPVASQLAQERGIAQGTATAVERGKLNIERLQKMTNRQAAQFLLDLAFREKALQAQIDQQNRQNTLGFIGDIGSAVGYGYGSQIWS